MYQPPKENWFRLPNDFIELTQDCSLAELRILIYLIRHTWGWNNQTSVKITLDELEHGRKIKGKRIDSGCGLCRQSIITGLKAAVDRGHLIKQVDDRDKGRVKNTYSINVSSQESKFYTPKRSKTYTPISSKDNKDKDSKNGTAPGGPAIPLDSPFFFMSDMLFETIKRRYKIDTKSSKLYSAAMFRNLCRSDERITVGRLFWILEWYDENAGFKYVPIINTPALFKKKFNSILAAIQRDTGKDLDDLPKKYNPDSDTARAERAARQPNDFDLTVLKIMVEVGIDKDQAWLSMITKIRNQGEEQKWMMYIVADLLNDDRYYEDVGRCPDFSSPEKFASNLNSIYRILNQSAGYEGKTEMIHYAKNSYASFDARPKYKQPIMIRDDNDNGEWI